MDAELRRALRRSRRQKTMIKSLSRENGRLCKAVKGSQRRIETLETQLARLRSTGAVLSRKLFGRKSEQQDKPRSERKRGQQRGAPGHGRTQRPGLEERAEVHNPPPDACICACCGQFEFEFEFEFDAVLFDRGRGAVSLTAAGETLYALAGPLVEGVEGLFTNFAERTNDGTGRLELAASVAGAAVVLPPYIKRFRDRNPGVRLRVRNCLLGEGMRLLRAGDVEFVIGAREPDTDWTFEYREMLSYDIVLITALDHPPAKRKEVTPREAAAWPAIVPPAGTYSRQFGETVARQLGLDVQAVIEVGGWGVIKLYVARGLGICVVPRICIHETDQVSVIPLRGNFPARSFGVYTRRGKPLTAPAQRMLKLLVPEPSRAQADAASTGSPIAKRRR